MMVLTLKAQSNHFDHLDQEFRGELKSIREEINDVRGELAEFKAETREEFKSVREQSDKRFDRLGNFIMWQTGVLASMIIAVGTLVFTK